MTTQSTVTLPRLIGHRGAAGLAPENTLAGLATAVANGLTWVEVDVRLARDGGLVLIHDDTLDRTTGEAGRVRDRTVPEIAGLDAGTWFGPEFAGERVPPIDDYLDSALALGVGVNLEIKALPGDEAETGHWLAHALAARGASPPLLVSSFLQTALAVMRDCAPEVPRGLLRRRLGNGWKGALARLDPSTLHLGARGLTRNAVERARGAGLPVAVYTVNDPAEAARLFAWGVDSLFTDRPDLLQSVLPDSV